MVTKKGRGLLVSPLTGHQIDALLAKLTATDAMLARHGWRRTPVPAFHTGDLYVDYVSDTTPMTVQVILSAVGATGALDGITVAVDGWTGVHRAHFSKGKGHDPTVPADVLRAIQTALDVKSNEHV